MATLPKNLILNSLAGMTIQVRVGHRLKLRIWLAMTLISLATWLIDANLKFESEEIKVETD